MSWLRSRMNFLSCTAWLPQLLTGSVSYYGEISSNWVWRAIGSVSVSFFGMVLVGLLNWAEREAGILGLKIDYNKKDEAIISMSPILRWVTFLLTFSTKATKNSKRFGTEELARIERRGDMLRRVKSTNLEYTFLCGFGKVSKKYIQRLQSVSSGTTVDVYKV